MVQIHKEHLILWVTYSSRVFVVAQRQLKGSKTEYQEVVQLWDPNSLASQHQHLKAPQIANQHIIYTMRSRLINISAHRMCGKATREVEDQIRASRYGLLQVPRYGDVNFVSHGNKV